jgi:N utilization substance protein B
MGTRTYDSGEKELLFSLSKAYDFIQLPFVIDGCHQELCAATHRVRKEQTHVQTEEDKNPNTRFVDNMFIAQLEVEQTTQ